MTKHAPQIVEKVLDKKPNWQNSPSAQVNNELTKIQQLKKMLADESVLYDENGDVDATLLLDMIEGETDLHELLLEVDESVAQYESNVEAIKVRIEGLNKRKARMQKSADTLRTIIMSAMDKAGIQKINDACTTLSLKVKPPSLMVTDESLLPSDYFEMKPILNKKTLLADLKDGKEIQGAELSPEGISLMIRRA